MDSKMEKIIEKLEKWYPEHKVFALDNVDKGLRENISSYAKENGKTVEELLISIGFELISGNAVYELRHPKLTKPGEEPEVFKDRIASILERLNEYYPDKAIEGSIQNEHKSLSGSISGAYQWLGYGSIDEFLAAYGYEYLKGGNGRPKSTNADDVIAELKKRYLDGPTCVKYGELVEANPDLKGKLKTLSNNAKSLFGMSMSDYLQKEGILVDKLSDQEMRKKQVAEASAARCEEKDKLRREKENRIRNIKDEIDDLSTKIIDATGIDFIDRYFATTECSYYEDVIQSAVEKRGGYFRRDVSKKTNYLILGKYMTAKSEYKTSKFEKAYDMIDDGEDIQIIYVDDFFDALDKYDVYVQKYSLLDEYKKYKAQLSEDFS